MTSIWITRSAPDALAETLRVQGHEVFAEPLIEIEKSSAWRQADSSVLPQLVLVTSQHAAAAYIQSDLLDSVKHCPHVAVGRLTASILEQRGISVSIPEESSSEGVLEHPQVDALQSGSRAWLIAGEGGRTLLADRLARRDVGTVKFEFYRRRVTLPKQVPLAKIDSIEVASMTALRALESMRQALKPGVVIVAVSQRIAEAASSAGFAQVVCAPGPEPAALAACLEALQSGKRQ